MEDADNLPTQASGYEEHFRQWWSDARQSEEPPTPYDFLINFGLHPETVQIVSRTILECSCSDSDEDGDEDGEETIIIQPGMMDHVVQNLFLTDQVKDESFSDWKAENFELMCDDGDEEQSLMRQVIGLGPPGSQPDRVSIADIKSLAELLTPDPSSGDSLLDRHRWLAVVNESMYRNYSAEIIQFLCNRVPDDSDGWNHYSLSFPENIYGTAECRQAMDNDCLLGLQILLPKLVSLTLGQETWTEAAFAKCMDILRNTTTLQKVEIQLPEAFRVDENTTYSPTTTGSPDGMLGNGSSPCGIEEFSVGGFDSDCCGGLYALQLLTSMPNLKKLCLQHQGSVPFKTAAPYITQVISSSTELVRLDVENWDSSTDDADVLDVLDALKAAPDSLVDFCYHEPGDRDDGQAHAAGLHASKLIELLEQNTNLTDVTLIDPDFSPPNPPAWKQKINFYLELNKNGRSVARSPNTSLADFVALLCHEKRIGKAVRFRGCYWSDFNEDEDILHFRLFNISYGLLRESPGIWSGSVLDRTSRKRKSMDD